jgi:hypothetical protein
MSQSSKFTRINLSEFNPPSDPGIQKQVCEYHPNDLQVVNTWMYFILYFRIIILEIVKFNLSYLEFLC